jgi:hypothetical protein
LYVFELFLLLVYYPSLLAKCPATTQTNNISVYSIAQYMNRVSQDRKVP